MADERIMRVLRAQAWERSKGELQSMLHTFWDDPEKFNSLGVLMTEFIKNVEDEELHT